MNLRPLNTSRRLNATRGYANSGGGLVAGLRLARHLRQICLK